MSFLNERWCTPSIEKCDCRLSVMLAVAAVMQWMLSIVAAEAAGWSVPQAIAEVMMTATQDAVVDAQSQPQ